MRTLEQLLSPIIDKQFPSFYEEFGPNFIQFVKAYYEWMELPGNPTNVTRNLMTWRDIDTTIDEFILHFKNEFLLNFPVITSSSTEFMVKHIKDYYLSKGSAEAIKLLFLLVFGKDAEIFYPNQHILRPSDGNWVLPEYIELEVGDLAKTYTNEIVYGSTSGASAFVEGFIRKRLFGKFVDVLFISHRIGNFQYGERITDKNGSLIGAPLLVGSLTSINITDGGANNKIGDLYTISGTYGTDGLARVDAVIDGTGKVLFTLVDGGSGYTNTGSNVYVSNSTMLYNNLSNSNTSIHGFSFLEQINEPLVAFPYKSILGANGFSVGQSVFGYLGGTLKANGYVVANSSSNSTSGNLVISVLSGDFTLANNIQITGNTINAQSNGGLAWINASGLLVGSNSMAIGVANVSNQFYANGAYVVGGITNSYANISQVGSGTGANFSVGLIVNPEIVSTSQDFFLEFNTGNVEFISYPAPGPPNSYPSEALSGWNANVGGNHLTNIIVYAGGSSYLNTDSVTLVGGNQGNTASPAIPATATLVTNSTGGITSAPLGNTGVNYYTMPGVFVTTSTGSGANLVANGYFSLGFPANPTGTLLANIESCFNVNTFTIGTIATLANQNLGNNYNIAPFVAIIQPYIAGFNRRDLILNVSNSNLLFAEGQLLYQSISGATASGIVKTANSSIITVKRLSFDVFFVADGITPLISKDSLGNQQGVAVINQVQQDPTTLPMGENAIVTTNVVTANGIASSVQILFSGYGYNPNDPLELTSNTNGFAIAGTANVENQGIGLGYWTTTTGLLNSDQIIHNNDVYQEFSYVVQTSLSLDQYSDLLKQLFHPSGFLLSGEVITDSDQDIELIGTSSQIELN